MDPLSVSPSSVKLRVAPSREQLLHQLYEAAELEHNLMCTYLYAAFSLRDHDDPSLSPREADAVTRWRATITRIATEEMAHLAAVWNITSALGGAPRFGRDNFPLDPGDMLPTRDGPLEIEPEINGPLVLRGNLEILSGTGRAVARVTNTRLCRCGGSANKPFCDGTHARIGFKSV